MNVIGESIDERGDIKTEHFLPIHREVPSFVEQATEQQIFVTGIKFGRTILWLDVITEAIIYGFATIDRQDTETSEEKKIAVKGVVTKKLMRTTILSAWKILKYLVLDSVSTQGLCPRVI